MRIIRFLYLLALRLLCLPVAAAFYVAGALSENASTMLISLIITLECAKNPGELEEEAEDGPASTLNPKQK